MMKIECPRCGKAAYTESNFGDRSRMKRYDRGPRQRVEVVAEYGHKRLVERITYQPHLCPTSAGRSDGEWQCVSGAK